MKGTTILLYIIIVVFISLAIFLYFYIAKPSWNNYILNKQMEAKDLTLAVILQELQQKGYVQITDMNNNSIILMPYVDNTKQS